MEKLYRSLLLISLASYLLFIFLPSINIQTLTEEEYDVLSWAEYGAQITFPTWLYWASIIAWFPLTLGLWLYQEWARKGFLLLSLVFVLLNPFGGLYVSTGLEMMFAQLTSSIDGAIIAICYLTSISKGFENA